MSDFRVYHPSYVIGLPFPHPSYMIQPIMFPCPVARSVYRAPRPSYMVSLSFFHANYINSLSRFSCKLHDQPIMFPFPIPRSVCRAPHPSYMVSLSCSLPTPVSLSYLDSSHKLGSNDAGKVARRQTGLSLRPAVHPSRSVGAELCYELYKPYIKRWGRPQRQCRFLLFQQADAMTTKVSIVALWMSSYH